MTWVGVIYYEKCNHYACVNRITLGENSFKIHSFILQVRLRHDTVILILSTAKTSHLFIFLGTPNG